MQEYLQSLTNEDNDIFKEIEALREEMISRDQSVDVVDYGAGNPEEKRSEQEMHKGVLKQVSTRDLCKIGLKNEFAHLIYALIKQYQPKRVLELGTCCGFSSIYMSKALGTKGEIHTIEGSPETAKIAQENFDNAHCMNMRSHVGRFCDVLPVLLPKIAPLDFAFIDGHHDRDATLEYFEQIKPFLSKNALVLFDDISWSEGMKEAWKTIKEDKDLVSFRDFHKVGLCLMGKEVQG